MKCTHCESELVAGARFCDTCGAPVVNPSAGEASEAGVPASPAAPVSTAADAFYQPEAAVPPPPAAPPVQPSFQPVQAYVPPTSFSSGGAAAYDLPQSDEKILGMPAAQMGMVTLVLGGVGLLLSFVGCGGLLCLAGLVTGFLSLKTAGRSNAIIGMVLSGIGLLISLVTACIFLFSILNMGMLSGY